MLAFWIEAGQKKDRQSVARSHAFLFREGAVFNLPAPATFS
jgi:hypothetical protein